MLTYLAQNPWRVAQWRWLRATAGGPETTARRDGKEGARWIRIAKRFAEAFARCDDDETLQTELAMEHPDVFWAHWLWTDNTNPSRWAVEAHLLARETDREIAFRVGCPEEVIKAYEALFFNVREKLDFKEYVLNVVLRESIARGLTDRHHDLLWKLFGYAGGSCVLDAMIGRLVNPEWVTRADGVPAFFQDAAINLMKKKAAVASLTVPVNNQTHINLIEAFVKYVEIERTTDSMGKATDQILGNIDAMLSSLPLKKGDDEIPAGLIEPATSFDHTGAELRHDELICVAAGFSLPGHLLLKNLAYPEHPSSHENTK